MSPASESGDKRQADRTSSSRWFCFSINDVDVDVDVDVDHNNIMITNIIAKSLSLSF